MSYTHRDLEGLIDKWAAIARSEANWRVAAALFCCVDDLILLITLSPNELMQQKRKR